MTSSVLDSEDVRVGATIRALREAYGLKVVEMARGCHISDAHLSNIEAGRSHATPKTCRAIAKLLDVPLAAITVKYYERIAEPEDVSA